METLEDTLTKRFSAILLAFAILALGSGARLLGHEGHEHKVMGTVTMAPPDHVMLKDRDGKDVTIKVTKDTKVKAKPMITVEQIKAGTRVVVTAARRKGQDHDGDNDRGWRTGDGCEVAAAAGWPTW